MAKMEMKTVNNYVACYERAEAGSVIDHEHDLEKYLWRLGSFSAVLSSTEKYSFFSLHKLLKLEMTKSNFIKSLRQLSCGVEETINLLRNN